MKGNKFLLLISTFNDDDWKKFKKSSQLFYTTNSEFNKIINYISRNRTKLDLKTLSLDELKNKINPSISTKSFMNSIYAINNFIEEFFILEELKEDEIQRNLLLIKSLSKRGLNELYKKKQVKIIDEIDKQSLDIWSPLKSLTIYHYQYYSNLSNSIEEGKLTLKKAISSLHYLYTNLLQFYKVELINRQTILKENWNEELEFINAIRKNKSPFNPIFNKLIELKSKKNTETYNYLYNVLINNESLLSTEIKYTIIIHLISYLNHEIKKGDIKQGLVLLQLYKYGLDKDILFPNGKIAIRSFLNILNTACVLKEISWANSFLENYAKYVGSTLDKEVQILGEAQIALTLNKPEVVVTLLRTSKFKNFDLELRSKIILMFAQYDLNQNDFYFLDSIFKSTLYFVNRNKDKVDKSTSQGLKNLIKYFNQIINKIPKQKISSQLKDEKLIFSKTWLQERIDKLN